MWDSVYICLVTKIGKIQFVCTHIKALNSSTLNWSNRNQDSKKKNLWGSTKQKEVNKKLFDGYTLLPTQISDLFQIYAIVLWLVNNN